VAATAVTVTAIALAALSAARSGRRRIRAAEPAVQTLLAHKTYSRWLTKISQCVYIPKSSHTTQHKLKALCRTFLRQSTHKNFVNYKIS